MSEKSFNAKNYKSALKLWTSLFEEINFSDYYYINPKLPNFANTCLSAENTIERLSLLSSHLINEKVVSREMSDCARLSNVEWIKNNFSKQHLILEIVHKEDFDIFENAIEKISTTKSGKKLLNSIEKLLTNRVIEKSVEDSLGRKLANNIRQLFIGKRNKEKIDANLQLRIVTRVEKFIPTISTRPYTYKNVNEQGTSVIINLALKDKNSKENPLLVNTTSIQENSTEEVKLDKIEFKMDKYGRR